MTVAADSSREPPAGAARERGGRRWVAAAGFVAGIGLLGAAMLVAVRAGEMNQAMESLRRAPPWMLAALLVLPLTNWLLTSAVFAVLTRRYGRVGWGEMSALIGSAWLLNMLPMRPGMIGRVAYHKVVNKVRVRDSARVLVTAMVCTAASAVVMVGAVAAAQRLWPGAAGAVVVGAAAPMAAIAMAGVVLWRRTPEGGAWRVAAACVIRYADVLMWSVRYWLVFDLIGRPVGLVDAAAIAAASQAAMVVPAQFGVREWMVGVASAMLTGRVAASGLTADLVNRGAELLVVLPVGLGSALWLWGRQGARARAEADDGPGEGLGAAAR